MPRRRRSVSPSPPPPLRLRWYVPRQVPRWLHINPERGMLEDGEEEQAQEVIHEDAHEYLLDLEDCLLNELTQKEDGSNDTDYDDELYTNMKAFWGLFSGVQTAETRTCISCGYTTSGNDDFDALLLYFPEDHHDSDKDCTLDDLIAHQCGTRCIDDYKCGKCNQKTTLTTKSVFINCPRILCIVLERKKLDGGSINSSVNFPVSGFRIIEDHLQYNLVGTVHHELDDDDHGHIVNVRPIGTFMMMKRLLMNSSSKNSRRTKS